MLVEALQRPLGDLLDTRNIRVDEPKVEEPKLPNFFSRLGRYNSLNSGNRTFTDKGENALVETIVTYKSLSELEQVIQMGMEQGMTATMAKLDELLLTIKK